MSVSVFCALFLQGKKAGTTYADMIAHALGRVEGGRGAFTEICDIIEAQFSDVLNWKLERWLEDK